MYVHGPQIDTPGTLCENIPLANGALARIHFTGWEWVAVVIHRSGEQDRTLRAATRAELLRMVGAEEQ